MPDHKDEIDEEDDAQKKPLDPDEVYLKSSGEVRVTPKRSLPSPPKDKRIHARRPLPPVPRGKDRDENDDQP
jgi:hypothetical protein